MIGKFISYWKLLLVINREKFKIFLEILNFFGDNLFNYYKIVIIEITKFILKIMLVCQYKIEMFQKLMHLLSNIIVNNYFIFL